jgi:hypothetical protein
MRYQLHTNCSYLKIMLIVFYMSSMVVANIRSLQYGGIHGSNSNAHNSILRCRPNEHGCLDRLFPNSMNLECSCLLLLSGHVTQDSTIKVDMLCEFSYSSSTEAKMLVCIYLNGVIIYNTTWLTAKYQGPSFISWNVIFAFCPTATHVGACSTAAPSRQRAYST